MANTWDSASMPIRGFTFSERLEVIRLSSDVAIYRGVEANTGANSMLLRCCSDPLLKRMLTWLSNDKPADHFTPYSSPQLTYHLPLHAKRKKKKKMMILLIAATTLGVFLTLLYIKSRLEAKKPFAQLPMPSDSHWLYGHLKILYGRNFPNQIYQICSDCANEHGQTGYWLAGKPTLSVLNVQDARTILLKESYRATIPLVYHYIARAVGEKTLIALNGREWKFHRDAITRT